MITFTDDIIITTEQAATLLCTPKSTLVKWRCTGENNIPFIKLGRSVRYRTTDLKKWLDVRSAKQYAERGGV
jgi:excisionase family DNA binding protein